MDVLPRIARQLFDVYREMSPVQRATSIAITFVVLVAFGWLLFFNAGPNFQPVSYGKVFTAEELASAEQALTAAGLKEFRRDGQRLLAPSKDLDKYNAALLESNSLPSDLGSLMLKQYETIGPFGTDRQRQQMEKALLLQELRRIIKKVSDIDDAQVAIASSDRRTRWNQKARTTANVTVKLRKGREVSSTLVNSLRHFVASMVPDLKPEDVTVFDLNRGHTFTGELSDDPTNNRNMQRVRELAARYEQRISKALSHIPGVAVTAHVDLDAETLSSIQDASSVLSTVVDPVSPLPSTIDDSDPHTTAFRGSSETTDEQSREIKHKTPVVAFPTNVQVSVSVPRDYLRKIANRRISKGEKVDLDQLEDNELSKVERIVGRLIPKGSSSDAISVTCVDGLAGESEAAAVPAPELAIAFAQQWGGWGVAGVFVLAGLWMLRRVPTVNSEPVVEQSVNPIEETSVDPHPPNSLALNPITANTPLDTVELLRDEIRSRVQADLAASTVLISQWLSAPDGSRKSSILLLSLDQALAAEVLGKLPREQVEQVTFAIANAETVSRDQQEATLNEFKTAFVSRPLMQPTGPETARELLERTLDQDEVQPVRLRMEEQLMSGPFAFLHHRHADDIRRLITDEHPQTVAVIVAQLPPDLAAHVLAGFTTDLQTEILRRLAQLGPTDVELLAEIAELMQSRIGRMPVRKGGVAKAGAVLREVARPTKRTVLQTLNQNDGPLATKLRESLFAFKDIVLLDDVTLKQVIEATDECHWAVALKGTPVSLQQRVFKALSTSLADALKQEMNSVGPLRLSEIMAVQAQIAEAVLLLDTENQIELPTRRTSFQRSEVGSA